MAVYLLHRRSVCIAMPTWNPIRYSDPDGLTAWDQVMGGLKLLEVLSKPLRVRLLVSPQAGPELEDSRAVSYLCTG